MDYKVTVIVPMYNVETYINETIDSVTSQTIFDEIELLIVDDCSTDMSLQLAEQQRKVYPSHIKLIRQPVNSGVSACRNTGLSNANGEYIFFLDSDDVLPHDALENLYQAAVRVGADLVTAPFNKLTEGELEEAGLTRVFPELSMEGHIDILKDPSILYSIFCWGKLYKKSMAENISFPEDISFGEDQTFTITAMLWAKRIYNISEITYHYRNRRDSITKTASTSKALKSSIRVWGIVEDRINSFSLTQKEMLKLFYFESCLLRDIWGPFRQALTLTNIPERHLTLNLLNDWITELPNEYIRKTINSFNSLLEEVKQFFPSMDTTSQQMLIFIFKTVKSKTSEQVIN
ncbi:glycosyltransferase family 2 protein [Terribacillus halophilus]|uniref:glycosyltransferase family 2 protein n=1 Tax=Terribacillus halophilus TaxID=361279 RepID=UPI0009864FFF|nr:glycosyltransferase family 2 protein [Terribacillus halophilus]